MQHFKNQEGVSLYLTIAIMVAVLAVGLGISTLILGEIEISRDIGRFVPAIYAADAGIERMLFRIRQTDHNPDCGDWSSPGPIPSECMAEDSLDDAQAAYTVWTAAHGNGAGFSSGTCDAGEGGTLCIKAIGSVLETNRSFEVSF